MSGNEPRGKFTRLGMRHIALFAVSLLAITSCTSNEESGQEEQAEAARPAGTQINNCGVELELDSPPERVFTVKSSTLEMLLALGLEDRVVGSAYLDGPVPEELTPSGWTPNVVSDEIPSREVLLSHDPDFVLAGWESNVSADGIGERDELAELGIDSYVLPPACEFDNEVEQSVTFEDIFAMFEEVGVLFDVEQEVEELVANQQQTLEDIEQPADEVDVLWYSSGSDAPFVAGAAGTPHMIMEAAGVNNVLDDVARTWFSISWEGFVSEDPDFIVLVDAPWNTAEDKRERIESHPAASRLDAVEAGNYIEIPFAATEAGIRNVDAASMVADAVAESQADQ